MSFGKYNGEERKLKREINNHKGYIRYHKMRIVNWQKKLNELEKKLANKLEVRLGMIKSKRKRNKILGVKK